MSETLKQRVAVHLEAGVKPSLKGRRVVLKDVVLVRADGTETAAAAEARRLRPNINLSFWSGETERQRNRVFAYDREGGRHTVQRKAGEQVVTRLGRRFYEEAPQTEWIFHLPIVNVRNGQQFNERYIDLTPQVLLNIFGPDAPEGKLLSKLTRTRGDQETLDRLIAQFKQYFPPGMHLGAQWEYEDVDEAVHTEVDNKELKYSMMRTGLRDGSRTVDVLLDRVVFGAPVTSYDL